MRPQLRSIDLLATDGASATTSAPVAPAALQDPAATLRGPAANAMPDVARIDSRRLFRGTSEVQIEHNGVLYRLKQTALGKLILTK